MLQMGLRTSGLEAGENIYPADSRISTLKKKKTKGERKEKRKETLLRYGSG